MGILDEAIREHLELKRKRGAEQGELRQLEDEAFGPAARPDEESTPESAEAEPESSELESPEEASPDTGEGVAAEASVEEQPEVLDEVPEPPGQTTRETIAQQPTEVFDVASELARQVSEPEQDASEEEAPSGETAEPAATDEQAAESETGSSTEMVSEQAIPTESDFEEAAAPAEADQEEGVEDQPEAEAEPEIFDEQALSEELEQALDGPSTAESRRTAFFEETDEFRTPPQRPDRQSQEPVTSEEDVLEETPEFLEETPEHDRLWFEQKPPKDFDFND